MIELGLRVMMVEWGIGSLSELSQRNVDKIALKYKIPNQYLHRALAK